MKPFKLALPYIKDKKITTYMSINKCYECSGKLSNKANSCPHCGAPSKNTSNQKSAIILFVKQISGVLLILYGAIISLGYMLGDEEENNYTISEDFLGFLLIGLLPIYLGFKLFSKTDIIIVFSNWLKKFR